MMMCAYVIQDMTVRRVIHGHVTVWDQPILWYVTETHAVLPIPVFVPFQDTTAPHVINLIAHPVWKESV